MIQNRYCMICKRRGAIELTFLIAIAAMLGLLVSPRNARADVVTPKGEIEILYQRIEQAYRAQNVRGLIAWDDDKYQVVFPNGVKFDRNRVIAAYTHQMSAIRKVKEFHIKIDSISLKNKTAVVETTVNATVTIAMQGRSLGEDSSTAHDRDTWEKTPQGWRRLRTDILQQSLIHNGKPVQLDSAPLQKEIPHK